MRAKTDFSVKTYNRCLQCPHRKVHCSGPRTAPMELARWCEFMRDMREVNGLTNAYIANESGVSVKTIERLLAPNAHPDQDIMRETARRIENAIIGSSSQYPCILAFEESVSGDAPKLKAALLELEQMQSIRDDAKREVAHLLTEVERMQREIDFLRVENDRKAKIIDKFLEK